LNGIDIETFYAALLSISGHIDQLGGLGGVRTVTRLVIGSN